LEAELIAKHSNALDENTENMSEQQREANRELNTSLVRQCTIQKDELRNELEDKSTAEQDALT